MPFGVVVAFLVGGDDSDGCALAAEASLVADICDFEELIEVVEPGGCCRHSASSLRFQFLHGNRPA